MGWAWGTPGFRHVALDHHHVALRITLLPSPRLPLRRAAPKDKLGHFAGLCKCGTRMCISMELGGSGWITAATVSLPAAA
eukprot:72896-Chlamydomonas_euryale.AAC.1